MSMIRSVCIGLLCLLCFCAQAQEKIWEGTACRSKQVTLTGYLPEGEPRAVVVVCPGGSYHWLDHDKEGSKVARWLAQEGYAAYVLQYRTAGVLEYLTKYRSVVRGYRHPDMICDLQRSIQLLRERYSCPLGVMGFSAGGHLVVMAGEFYQTNFLERYGIEPEVSLRPDFVAAIYPVVTLADERYVHRRSRLGLLGEWRQGKQQMRDSLSLEKHVGAHMPPVFLLNCTDDPLVGYHNSVLLDSALGAMRIPHLYVQMENGGHGFGADSTRMQPGTTDTWQERFVDWLLNMSF